MKKILLISAVLFVSMYGIASAQMKNINICTPEWRFYTQKDGKGLYHDLFKEIFVSNGIKVVNTYHPFKRCEFLVLKETSEKFDGYPGGYGASTVIIPHWHIGIEFLTVTYKKGTLKEWKGQESLVNKRVAWERGYGFDKNGIVNVKIKLHEFSKLKSAMRMLVAGRIDFILDYPAATKQVIEELGISDQVEFLPDIIKGPKAYMVFADTEKGKKLAEIWDKEMERLYKSGQLHKMYKQYEDLSY